MRANDAGTDSDLTTGTVAKPQLWVERRQAALGARAAAPAREALPEAALQGTWTERTNRRLVNQVLLGVGMAGSLVGMGLLLSVQTFDALAVLVAFTVMSLMAYTALSVSHPTTVTLTGPLLVVERGDETDEFDLSGHIRRVSTIGRANRPNWRVRLETEDGKIVELGPTQTDPALIQAAISRYRAPRVPTQRTPTQD